MNGPDRRPGRARIRFRRCPRHVAGIAYLLAGTGAWGCAGPVPDAEPVSLTVPAGASFAEVVDTLVSRQVVRRGTLFRLYARWRGVDRDVKSGEYLLRPGERWSTVLDVLTSGNVVTVPVTVPEGFVLGEIAQRLAPVTGLDSETVLQTLTEEDAAERWGVPGPGLEGYLFPDTYRFAQGVPLETVIQAMVDRYQSVWTAERRAALDSLALDEREVVTLASIIEAEALMTEEMPLISAVYHNRLRIGYLLQADPTVLYALGGRRERLLYAAIDSVADHPYNTYTQPGLPPGPIGAPGEAAIDAALHPDDVDYLYFVARPDGTHIFTRSLEEHNRARNSVRRLQRESEGR